MEVPIEVLVSTLYRRFQNRAHPPRGNTCKGFPSLLFSIALDVAQSLDPEERERHLVQLLNSLQVATTNTTGECVPAVVSSASALIVLRSSHPSLTHRTLLSTQHESLDMENRFGEIIHSILVAHPPFPEDVIASTCYGAAQLILHNCCRNMFHSACGSLDATLDQAELKIPATSAVELLSYCTSLLVNLCPIELPAEGITGALSATSAGTGVTIGERRDKKSVVSSERWNSHLNDTDVGPKVDRGQMHEAPICSFLTPPDQAARCALKKSIISCCFRVLGQSAQLYRSDVVLTALLCRRVLIPLLLLKDTDEESLRVFEPQLHELLEALYSSGDQNAGDAEDGKLGSHSGNRSEVIVLIAALFDFLFRHSRVGDAAQDYRCSPFLWRVLHRGFWDALTSNTDAGRRANMQLRAEYLLKRIIHLTHAEKVGGSLKVKAITRFRESRTKLRDFSSGETARRLAVGVSSTHCAARGIVRFHEWFVWDHDQSFVQWEQFFLILETMKEFGLHIVEPALLKLDALIKLQSLSMISSDVSSVNQENRSSITNLTDRSDNMDIMPSHLPYHTQSILHPVWIEILFLKLILHPNIGVRKLGLRRVWRLPLSIIRGFSSEFLFHYVFQSSSDPRLCSDLDRIPITMSFLETPAFEGGEEKALRSMEPLIQEIERFYCALFTVHLRSAEARVAALCRILDTASEQTSRFTTTVLVRTLHTLAGALFNEAKNCPEAARWTTAMALHEAVLERLSALMHNSFQDNVPFWLSIRMTCIIFSMLLTLASINPSTFRSRASFWSLLCMCGPLGRCGGHQAARLDARGQYGRVGSGVDARFLTAKLLSLAKRMEHIEPEAEGVSDGSQKQLPLRLVLIHDLLQTQDMLERTKALLARASAYGSSFDEVSVKEHFFLMGVLLQTSYPEDLELAQNIIAEVVQNAASYRTRAYSSTAGFLTSLSALVEVHREFGTIPCSHLFSMPVLIDIASTVNTRAFSALMWGKRVIEGLEPVGFISEKGEVNEEVVLLHTANWDVLTATVVMIYEIVLKQSTDEAEELLKVSESIHILTHFAENCGACFGRYYQRKNRYRNSTVLDRTDVVVGSTTDLDEALVAQQMAHIVLARNASRLLQSNLYGLVCLPRDRQWLGNDALKELMPEFDEVRCFLSLNPSKAASLITKLTDSLTQRAPAITTLCVLSDSTPQALLAEHSRCVYNTISILCERVVGDQQAYHDIVQHLERFGMEQVGQCWTGNLAAVYDILAWVVACPDPNLVDHAEILNTMFEHVRDVGAREHARVSSIAFSALHRVMPHHPHLVSQTLKRMFGTDVESERFIFFAASTASLQVLADAPRHWPPLQEALLHIAVFFNPGRDEEEGESTMAVTEPLLWGWPKELREVYPPTVRLSTVGRALALSTILHTCAQAPDRAYALCLELLHLNTRNPVVAHEPCMPNSRTHRVRLRLWQLLCSMLPLLPVDDHARVGALLEVVLRECVPINNLGSVRRLMELFTIRLLQRVPAVAHLVVSALGNYNLRPQACGTYVLVACHVLLHLEELEAQVGGDRTVVPGLCEDLLHRILQQCTSNQHLLRIISHIGLFRVCRLRRALGKSIPNDVNAIFEYVAGAEDHIKFRQKYEEILFYNIEEACTPHNIFCIVRKDGNAMLRESIPAAMFERIRFLETETCCLTGIMNPADRLRWRRTWGPYPSVPSSVDGPPMARDPAYHCLTGVFKDFPYIPHAETLADGYLDYTAEVKELLTTDPSLLLGDGPHADGPDRCEASEEEIQKKVTSWWNSEVYNQLHPRAAHGDHQRQSLVVVGSLLENPVNIAGLCRCGEIFAVERIIIPEQKVFEHPHFVATARSAELWIPWQEVRPKDLLGYLASMQREGYTVIGIEQTSGSVSIASYQFPSRAVVVLGSEGHGIPAAIIPLLDVCVEVPQYGLIRSLNVHVTGAIVMYEYTRQHLMIKDYDLN
ncbi:unnamed protein product [Phytomonas sp. EM1]|nr:unnamed protein product [Phytomonas sp. EM1]|eukprot:CCW60382.1 unnamed protein product [Phytomonas sp. isolate EM1]